MQYLNHFQNILTLLQSSGITLKLEKYSILVETIHYLGRVSFSRRLKMGDAKNGAVKSRSTFQPSRKSAPSLGSVPYNAALYQVYPDWYSRWTGNAENLRLLDTTEGLNRYHFWA